MDTFIKNLETKAKVIRLGNESRNPEKIFTLIQDCKIFWGEYLPTSLK